MDAFLILLRKLMITFFKLLFCFLYNLCFRQVPLHLVHLIWCIYFILEAFLKFLTTLD